jgi:hypothetical protein
LPKRNYGHEKRQKELNKQKKKEEKLQRRHERAANPPEDVRAQETGSVEPPSGE